MYSRRKKMVLHHHKWRRSNERETWSALHRHELLFTHIHRSSKSSSCIYKSIDSFLFATRSVLFFLEFYENFPQTDLADTSTLQHTRWARVWCVFLFTTFSKEIFIVEIVESCITTTHSIIELEHVERLLHRKLHIKTIDYAASVMRFLLQFSNRNQMKFIDLFNQSIMQCVCVCVCAISIWIIGLKCTSHRIDFF